ncbi:MAG: fimbria/pilus outer membrane usher protein [Pseudomonadota bacterium]|nr:fimbria/pilus outer membrane usher protein [Pseudomonadota bacterium]
MPTRKARSAPTSLALLALVAAPVAAAAGEIEAGAAPAFEPTLLEVTVNGQPMAEPLLLMRDSGGGIYASAALLRAWRIRPPSSPPVEAEGELHYRIDDMPALRATFSAAEQSLAIEARPELFEAQRASLAASVGLEMTPAASGGFLNYDLIAEHSSGRTGLSGAIEAGAFTRFGVGSSGFILRAGNDGERILRLDTSWTIDRPASLSSIRIGDGISAAGPGAAPLRFGGIQFARNFAVQPGYVTMPLPVLEGSAAVPSIIDVYVNNALQGSSEVAPGPFELTNVPVQTGGGTVQLVVRDLLGRQIVSEQSYYASAVLLRRGLHDFSYELGFLRESFGVRSFDYRAPVASTRHRYGLTDRVTLEGHAQASPGRQLAGVGLVVSLFDLATLGGAASVSRSEKGGGIFLSGSIERRTQGLSFGVRSDYASAGFAFVGMTDENRPARLSTQAFADLPLFGGSVGLNLLYRDRRDGADESLAGLFANLRLIDEATVQLFARRSVVGNSQTVLGAHVSVALGPRRSAGATVEYRGGSFAQHVAYQDDPPPGIGSGYRAAARIEGGRRSFESVYSWNAAPVSLTGHVGRAGGTTGFRLSASGAVGLIGGRPFASRTLGSSFAEVRVGSQPGVRVYADNQLVGVTGANGRLVVPSLRAFDRNVIRIDEADLPLDTQIAATELAVRPFGRSGAVVAFALRRERGVLMRVRLEDGSDLPAGALVRVEGSGESHVVASGGEVYLPSLDGTATLEARWSGLSCRFTVTVPDDDDPQPRIDGLLCRAAPVYAEG